MSPITQMSTSGTGSGSSGSNTNGTGSSPPLSENMFLQLLIAQLQNQDPTNPADSTQFVTQLAQFQTMEQSMNQSQDISAIRHDLDQLVASLTANSNSTGSAANH